MRCRNLIAGLWALSIIGVSQPASAAQPIYDFDALGREYCAQSQAGNLGGLAPLLSDDLRALMQKAHGNPAILPPKVLFQSYSTPAASCSAETQSAAFVEITRVMNNGGSWTEYLVVAPQVDGTTRIEDVFFAARRSDTLRNRLTSFAN